MSDIRVKFRLIENDREISYRILEALQPKVDKYFRLSMKRIQAKLSNIIIDAIKSTPEYDSLISGSLMYEFGLPDSAARLDSIFTIWKKIYFEYDPVVIRNNSLRGSYTLNMIRSDFLDTINTEAAVFVTEKGSNLNWLQWLCLEGNKTIIKDYNIDIGPNTNSRTGMAVMRGVVSGKWSVPSEFSGTIDNNWITRAIDSASGSIQQTIMEGLKI